MNQELLAEPLIRDNDEGLFGRDFDGQLLRLDKPTEKDFEEEITLTIDGHPVTVKKAEPLKDADGNIVQDLDGRPKPRYTTIYDAAAELYVNQLGGKAEFPIPVLCHQDHMKPVAVCRLCVVQIYGKRTADGKKGKMERKLLPACQQQVRDGMEVYTMNGSGPDGEKDGAKVRSCVRVLTELLAADHLKPASPGTPAEEFAPFNELRRAVESTKAQPDRFKTDVFSKPLPTPAPKVGRGGLDISSPVFQIDHSACILCDRCVRGCDDVRDNQVIGRTGKGVTAGIGFDLNDPMGRSSCVQCGECMVSCPTSAIIFKPSARVKVSTESRAKDHLAPATLLSDPIFRSISPKFLLWQQGLVVRRTLRKGDVVCRQGEAGNTAFIIREGTLEVTVKAPTTPPDSFLGQFLPRAKPKVAPGFQQTPKDLIVGEMACLTSSPRTATVTALTNGEVWEIRRNVLDRLMRVPHLRQRFDKNFRERVLNLTLQQSELFRFLAPDTHEKILEFLRPLIRFVRVSPGQSLFLQGEAADAMYFVRLGHVRVSQNQYGMEAKVLSRGPGTIVGEIGLLGLTPEQARQKTEEVYPVIQRQLKEATGALSDAIPTGVRTAMCSALGHLELARLEREDFLRMIRDFPRVGERLVSMSLARLRDNAPSDDTRRAYIDQGLYEGQSILVLDLDRCTRCDQCTRGCIEEHGTASHGVEVSRLMRDGMRYGKYLVATSCRSCTDAHCMVGCPVDSIHRGKHQQIVIEDHCIGCGLCASNCPYGSIFMMPNQRQVIASPDPDRPGSLLKAGRLKAAACDLCDAHGDHDTPKPQCVAACPHDAAFRMTGRELLDRVLQGR